MEQILIDNTDTYKECLIDGTKYEYHACSRSALSKAKKYYEKAFRYIGSSHVLFINGTRNHFDELHHFFVRIEKHIGIPTKSNTYTFTTTDDCLHENYTFKKVRVNFYLFELTMLFKVCHKCHKLIKDHNKWKIKI